MAQMTGCKMKEQQCWYKEGDRQNRQSVNYHIDTAEISTRKREIEKTSLI